MNSIFEAYVCIAEGKFSSGNSLYAVLIGRWDNEVQNRMKLMWCITVKVDCKWNRGSHNCDCFYQKFWL